MNRHWASFTAGVPWFPAERTRVEVGPLLWPGSWRASTALAARFPKLARLLASAHTSWIRADGSEYTLFSWEGMDGVSSWLARAPEGTVDSRVFPEHRALLGEFGGIVERTGDPEGSWLLNTSESLTLDEAQHDAGFLRECATFEELPGGIPIDMEAYYSISREANGNDTLCHRTAGDVLLFAPDHAFDHVVPLEGCPDYTLYRIRGARTFVEWVEVVAQQWMRVATGEEA
jgi:hypothetical protein